MRRLRSSSSAPGRRRAARPSPATRPCCTPARRSGSPAPDSVATGPRAPSPPPPLLPAGADERAHVLSLALTIAADIHPLNNLRVLKRLAKLGVEQAARDDWYRHWVRVGFEALEALAAPRAGRFLFGDVVSLADICLVPQMYNARRFELPLDPYPTLVHADAEAAALD